MALRPFKRRAAQGRHSSRRARAAGRGAAELNPWRVHGARNDDNAMMMATVIHGVAGWKRRQHLV
jgi:hypothetical protein